MISTNIFNPIKGIKELQKKLNKGQRMLRQNTIKNQQNR